MSGLGMVQLKFNSLELDSEVGQLITPAVILRVLGVSGLPGPQGWPGRPGSCDIGQCKDLVRIAKKPHSKARIIERKEKKRKKKEKRERRRKQKKENLKIKPN